MTIKGLPSLPKDGPKPIRRPFVRFRANFIRHEGDVISTVIERTGRKADHDLLQATVQKDISSPFGSYRLSLVPRQDYLNLVSPGDWCELEVDNNNGLGFRRIMYGPITDIRRRKTIDQKGAPSTSVAVTGSDFGRVIAYTEAILDPALANETILADIVTSFFSTRLQDLIAAPNEVLETLVRFFFLNIRQWVDPRTDNIFGFIAEGKVGPANPSDVFEFRYLSSNLLGEARLEAINVSASLWQVLQQWANITLNELFIDYRPPFDDQTDLVNLVPAIVLRQYPFFGGDYEAIPRVVVEASEVKEFEIGKSDADVRNWIRVIDEPRLTGIRGGVATYSNQIGLFNPSSIEKFGFRREEPPSPYVFDPNSTDPKHITEILEQSTALKTQWHHSNELLFNGYMKLYSRPDIRVGYRLDYSDPRLNENLSFYIEGVDHTFTYPGTSFTTVRLTRGFDSTDVDSVFNRSADLLEAEGLIKRFPGLPTTVLQRINTLTNTLETIQEAIGGEEV